MSDRMIYFIRRTDGTGPIKIGCSSHLERRIYQLGIDYRAEFTVLATAPGTYLTERNVHLKFAKHRVKVEANPTRRSPTPGVKEWFAPVPELLAFIETVKAAGAISLTKADCRERIFAERYARGDTLQQIADDYDLTRERVRQVLRHTGVPSLGLRPQHRLKPHELTDAEIAATKAYQSGAPTTEICEQFGLDRFQLLRACRRVGVAVRPSGAPFKCDPAFVAARLGKMYREGVTSHEIARYFGWSNQTYVYRWLARLGIQPTRKPRRSAQRRAA